MGEREGLAFRVQLFVLLFECYADRAAWDEGLRACNDAFAHVPTSLQRPLWQWRVVFMSKLGKSVLDGMAKMKESDAVLQARVWATLARAATDRRQQLSAYSKAVDTLEGHFERVDYVVELAEWLLAHQLPKRDAADALASALDLYPDVEENAAAEAAALASVGGGGGGD